MIHKFLPKDRSPNHGSASNPQRAGGKNTRIPVEILPDNDSLIARFAADLLQEYLAAKAAGREKVVFILPVGPVGQYEILADRCNREKISLRDLVVINMDEYLTPDGRDFIPWSDPLGFRRHMEEHFYRHLHSQLAPPDEHRIFPHPLDLSRVPETIARFGGADACFGGVGITGHVAFNDPPEPGEGFPWTNSGTCPRGSSASPGKPG